MSAGLWGISLPLPAQYLPVLGPAPLRWQEAATPNPALVASLPPLVVLEPDVKPVSGPTPPPTPVPAPTAAEPASAEANTNILGPFLPAPTVDSGTNQAPVDTTLSSAGSRAVPAIPMETLAPFFSAPVGTNWAGSVTLPLNFVPPAAPPPPSSSATYSTPKP